MEVPKLTIEKWQTLWQQIYDMSYYRKNVVEEIITDVSEYDDLYKYQNFNEITLEYIWKFNSSFKNVDGEYLHPLIVPELKKIYVPRFLFETLGVFEWFKYSFPKCKILFWEDYTM